MVMNKIDNAISESLYSTNTSEKTISVLVKKSLTNNNNSANLKTSQVLRQIILLLIFFFALITINAQQVKAFPTAKGAGAYTTGGRGKPVYIVTNLNNSGPGSLRQIHDDTAATNGGIITFAVSGTIVLTSRLTLSQDNITIAGQTAPAGGITIVGSNNSAYVEYKNASNFIIRYIRFRPKYTEAPTSENDSFYMYDTSNYIVDHCSFSWATDEVVDAGNGTDYTWQRNLFAESNKTGVLIGAEPEDSENMSFINNMFYNCSHRFPNWQSNGRVDVINNVIWNFRTRLSVVSFAFKANHIGNYYQYFSSSPSSDDARWMSYIQADNNYPTIYTKGNYISDVLTNPNADNWFIWRWRFAPSGAYSGAAISSQLTTDFRTTTQFPLLGDPFTIKSATDAFDDVRNNSGANVRLDEYGNSIEDIDGLDSVYLTNVQNDILVQYGQVDVLNTAHRATFLNSISTIPINTHPSNFDTNNDGIPNQWVVNKGFSVNDDLTTYVWASGYVGIEEYLNGVDNTTNNTNTTLAEDDISQTTVNTPVNGNVSINDSDPQGDNQTITRILTDTDGDGISDNPITIGAATSIYGTDDTNATVPAGAIKLNGNGTYTHTPETNFIGEVEVLYTVTDDNILPASDDATLYLTTLPNSTAVCSGEITSYPYSEGFENTLGAWTQSSSNDIDWTVDAGGTTSGGTGPSSASQGTYYVYVEASGNETGFPTKQAILNSPCFNLSGLSEANFSFKYHQYGSDDMGSIGLEASDDNGASWTSIWNSTGNKGDTWLLANVDLGGYVGGSIQLRFNRVTGSTWVADLAIDDVNLSGENTQANVCSDEITSFPYSEGFENTFGAWTQSSSNDIDWIVDADGTPSSGTGPTSATQGIHYVYVEASGALTKHAILNSPCFNLSGLSGANFSFKYHQYGSDDMGSIDLEVSDDNGASWTSIWDSTGNLGNTWLTADVDLSAYVGGNVKLRFNRIIGNTWQGDFAIDDVSLSERGGSTGGNTGSNGCSDGITSFPYFEGFENTLGAWAQSSSNDIDWTVDADGTPSSGTGPSSATQGTYYVYVEATGALTKQAILNSPCFNLSGLSGANFSFKYHQYGSDDMGSIDLEASDDNGASWTSIWGSTGNLGNTWLTADVDLSAYVGGNVQLRFNRIIGNTWKGDLAIDDVSLSEGGGSTGGNGCSDEITSFPYSEGFENTLGAWAQSSSNDIDWTVDADGTPSSGTGPSSATQGTYYVYVEATGALTKQAILNSPCFNLSGLSGANFSFKYHQYGSDDMGSIDLEASDDNGASWTSIWGSTGNLGNTWLTADVDLSAYVGGNVQLRFNRIIGNTWQGDFAIDDVSLSEGGGSTGGNTGSNGCSDGIISFPYSEGFENTLGAWTQSTSDDNNWKVNDNGTPSSQTGPSIAIEGTYYVYVEASGTGTGIPTKQALLNSPCFDLSSQDSATLSFNYHQFGASDMGTIDLEASDDNGVSWVSIWNSSGNLGDSWQSASVDLSTYIGGSVQLRFNRITGSTWQADIAIDNVNLSTGMARIQTAKTVFDDIKEITIYPNPVKDNILNIKSTYSNISYKIYSTVGQLVSKGNVKNNAINIGDLNRAIYQITFSSEGEIITKQFIKQ